MTITAEGRSRPRLVKLVAGLALVGSAAGLITTGAAGAQVTPPVGPPLNLTVANVPGVQAINIDWDAPTAGPGITPPTLYEVTIDNTATVLSPDFTTAVPSAQTFLNGFAVLPSTTYVVTVTSRDGTAPPPAKGPTNTATTTFLTAAGVPTPCAVAIWQPFCTVEAFINQQYRDWESRAPRLDEMNFWRAYLTPRDQIAGGTQNQFLDNFRQNKDLIAGPVTRLYTAYFLRNPDFGGYEFWLDAVTTNRMSINEVSEFFARSAEFQLRYGALDNAEFVSLVYQNVLGRNPDPTGFAFWTRQLNAGQTRGWMMLQFSEAPSLEFQTRTRVAVAATEVYAAMLNRVPSPLEYAQALTLMNPSAYPLTAPSVNPLYLLILNSAEYRSAGRNGGPIVVN